MKPAPFDYHAPSAIDGVVDLLVRHRGDARLLAGGQTLVPMMNYRLATPTILVDLNRIPELAYIREEKDAVRIGAMTRQRSVEFSRLVARDLPVLQAAIRMVGHLPTRSRGTIGGSIANADAAAEIPMVLQVLEGEVSVRGPNGVRTIAAGDLIEGAMVTTLAEDEVLTEVRFPKVAKGTRFAVEEFSRRHGDFAIAAATVVLELNDGICTSARISTAGVSARSRRLAAAEEVLQGRAVDADAIAAAADAAAEAIDPLDDRNASADYRRHLTGVLTGRALQQAIAGI